MTKVSKAVFLPGFGCSFSPNYVTVRRSYKQKVLETHPDKLPPTASEEEKNLAQGLFRQVTLYYPAPSPEMCSHASSPIRSKRRLKSSTTLSSVGFVQTQFAFRFAQPLTTLQAYDIHHRPLPQQTPVRTNSRASTLSSTATSASASTKTPAQTSAPSRADKPTSSRSERPHSGTVVVLDRLNEAQARRVKERSEWMRKAEERRLDKLKAYNAAEEIQNLGQKQAALVEKMIQDLFALTPEWEMRRMKARAVSIHLFRLITKYSPVPW